MKSILCLVSAAVATLIITPVPAVAHDFAPPSWRLQGPYSTLQGWDFQSASESYYPDHPNLSMVFGDGRSGFWPLAGAANFDWDPYGGSGALIPNGNDTAWIELIIPNWIDFEQQKWLWLQVTYIGNQPPAVTSVQATDNVSSTVNIVWGLPELTPLDPFNGVYGLTQKFTMYPNPDQERLRLDVPPGVAIDQIIVDTISFSVPEPGSALLLAGGGLAVIARHRKRRPRDYFRHVIARGNV